MLAHPKISLRLLLPVKKVIYKYIHVQCIGDFTVDVQQHDRIQPLRRHGCRQVVLCAPHDRKWTFGRGTASGNHVKELQQRLYFAEPTLTIPSQQGETSVLQSSWLTDVCKALEAAAVEYASVLGRYHPRRNHRLCSVAHRSLSPLAASSSSCSMLTYNS